MKDLKKSVEIFNEYLSEKSANYLQSANDKKAKGEQYEHVLDKIRFNVVSIFTQLFNTAIKQIEKKDGPVLRIYSENENNPNKQIENVFMGLLKKISGQWALSLEEAKKHNDTDTITKENAKIEVANQLLAKFDGIFG